MNVLGVLSECTRVLNFPNFWQDEDALDMSRATGLGDGEDFASRLKRITQLTGLSDPVYAEAVVTVHDYDIVLDVLVCQRVCPCVCAHARSLCLCRVLTE